jgi:penicillin-binding protein 1C
LTGVTSAAPILFDVLIYCQDNDGLIRQLRDLEEVEVYFKRSFGQSCPTIKQLVSKGKHFICPYHKTVHLDKSLQFQVNSSCENIEKYSDQKNLFCRL